VLHGVLQLVDDFAIELIHLRRPETDLPRFPAVELDIGSETAIGMSSARAAIVSTFPEPGWASGSPRPPHARPSWSPRSAMRSVRGHLEHCGNAAQVACHRLMHKARISEAGVFEPHIALVDIIVVSASFARAIRVWMPQRTHPWRTAFGDLTVHGQQIILQSFQVSHRCNDMAATFLIMYRWRQFA